MVDSLREGWIWTVGLLVVGAVAIIPAFVGALLTRLFRSNPVHVVIWLLGALIVTVPGLGIWIFAALQPVPRQHEGSGQMHIFFFPVLHVVLSIPIYLMTAFVHWTNINAIAETDRTFKVLDSAVIGESDPDEDGCIQ